MSKNLQYFDEMGEPLETPRIILSDKEKKEYKNGIKILKKYNAYVSPEDQDKLYIRLNSKSQKLESLQNKAAPTSFLAAVWSAGALYAMFIDHNNNVAAIFIIMTLATCLGVGYMIIKTESAK